jgi:hypothetical protein
MICTTPVLRMVAMNRRRHQGDPPTGTVASELYVRHPAPAA